MELNQAQADPVPWQDSRSSIDPSPEGKPPGSQRYDAAMYLLDVAAGAHPAGSLLRAPGDDGQKGLATTPSGIHMHSARQKYSTRLNRVGALLPDTRSLLAVWNPALSADENFEWVRRENLLSKGTRARAQEVLAIFRQRYVEGLANPDALARLVQRGVAPQILDRILFFHTAQADALLHDAVTEILAPIQWRGGTAVTTNLIQAELQAWVAEGRTERWWSASTTYRLAQGILSTLRDFGIVEGAARKRLAPVYLPIESFAYVAFALSATAGTGRRLVQDPEWRLFFLSTDLVERFFLEAHQQRLLEYHAAGSIVRIDFPTDSLMEYADALTQGAR